MPLSEYEIKEIAKASAQAVLEGLHRYAVEYKEPGTIKQGLQDSMIEERTAAEWYRKRAKQAEEHVSASTYALYQELAREEDHHYDQLSKELESFELDAKQQHFEESQKQ